MVIIGILIAAFILWHFLPPPKPPRPRPQFRGDLRAKPNDPQWRSVVEEHCESPAETAFLAAMVEAYSLLPDGGSLRGQDLKLDLQVGEGRYRIDFLANEWLVIEIDGAAYHSSPEAQERDRTRDEYFEELGYSVLRIPAKVVFNTPREAMRRVRAALAVGKRQIVEPVPVSGFERLRGTASGFARAVEEMNASVSRRIALDRALSEAMRASTAEKRAIDCAIEIARTTLEVEARVLDDQGQIFEGFKSDFASRFDRGDGGASVVPEFPPLPSHSDPTVAKLIEAAYERLATEREVTLANARRDLQNEPRLRPLVEATLAQLGCPQVWSRIS